MQLRRKKPGPELQHKQWGWRHSCDLYRPRQCSELVKQRSRMHCKGIVRRWHGLDLPKQCKVRWKVPKGPRVCWACLYSVSFSCWFQVMFALQKSELHTHPMWFWRWTDAWHDRLGQYVWIILQPEQKEDERWSTSFREREKRSVLGPLYFLLWESAETEGSFNHYYIRVPVDELLL